MGSAESTEEKIPTTNDRYVQTTDKTCTNILHQVSSSEVDLSTQNKANSNTPFISSSEVGLSTQNKRNSNTPFISSSEVGLSTQNKTNSGIMTMPSSKDLQESIEYLSIDNKHINILLLGATGVGKSTIINSIANYLTFDGLTTAVDQNPIVLIPSNFKLKDKYNKIHDVVIGSEDVNEYLEHGVSATQDVKTYVFPIWQGKALIRLIDTPGMGDTRGIEKDDENSENILSYISELHELHAICLLLKPNEYRSTLYFEYCMSQILSRLDKSASKNIIFIFTHTRGTDYTPGETMSILKKTIDTIKQKPPHAEIPLNINVFCFENEAFRYLAGIKNNLEFDESHSKLMSNSWKKSSEECWKMIKYIVGDINNPPLKPHFVKNTNAINEARRMISYLTRPLAEISQLINQNMDILQRHEEDLEMNENTIEQLKGKLYMPVVSVDIEKLNNPTTVCTSRKCAEIYKVGDRNNWHYKQRCHEPCYLTNVKKETIGSPELMRCAAMSNMNCTKCSCCYSVHMHVYYLTKIKDDRIIDPNIQQNIDRKEKVLENVKTLIKNMANKKNELNYEHKVIINCCAEFAHFLQNNAITPFSDAYKDYIEYLINREKSLGIYCKKNTIDHLQSLLREYEEKKTSFDRALKMGNASMIITPKQIHDSIQKLYNLKHNGKKIKELYECQKKSRRTEFANTEYIHKIQSNTTKGRNSNQKLDQKSDEVQNKSRKKKENRKSQQQRASQQRSSSPPPPYSEQEHRRHSHSSSSEAYHSHPSTRYNPRPNEYNPPPPAAYNPPPSGEYHPPPSGVYHPPPSGAYHPPPSGSYHPPPPGAYNPPYNYSYAHTSEGDHQAYDVSITVKNSNRPNANRNNNQQDHYPSAHGQSYGPAYPPPQASAYPPPQGPAYAPPHGSAYPPHGSAYPPHGSAYPPHGSAYPPHGSAYPSHGSAYPPPPHSSSYYSDPGARGGNYDGQHDNNSNRRNQRYRQDASRDRQRDGVQNNTRSNSRNIGNQSDPRWSA